MSIELSFFYLYTYLHLFVHLFKYVLMSIEVAVTCLSPYGPYAYAYESYGLDPSGTSSVRVYKF
jgi:hypothetical protein